MTYNVDPDLGAILSMLEYKMKQRGVTRAEVQAELDWKSAKLGRIFNRQREMRVDELLQILAVIDIEPVAFMREAYGHRNRPVGDREQLRVELGQLLQENLEVAEASLPQQGTGFRRYLESDTEELLAVSERATTATRELAAMAHWMLPRIPDADRRMLVGLALRTDSFEKAIAAEKELLMITGSPLEAAWAIEHEVQLSAETWTRTWRPAPTWRPSSFSSISTSPTGRTSRRTSRKSAIGFMISGARRKEATMLDKALFGQALVRLRGERSLGALSVWCKISVHA